MNLLGRLALLFVVIPIIELMLLIELGQIVGLLPTLALVMLTGVTGAWLARAESLRVKHGIVVTTPAAVITVSYSAPSSLVHVSLPVFEEVVASLQVNSPAG